MIGWRGGYGAPKAPGRSPDVVVIVSGGLVQDVLRDPDLTVEVRDYDGDHEGCDECERDDAGDLFHRCVYESDAGRERKRRRA